MTEPTGSTPVDDNKSGDRDDEGYRERRWPSMRTIPNRTSVWFGDVELHHRLGHNTVVRGDQNNTLLLGDPWDWLVRLPPPRDTRAEDDEPIDELIAAFERGRPVVTGRPVYTTPGHLNSLREGTLLRAVSAEHAALAWCVTTTGRWAVTGERSIFDSRRLLRFVPAWERLGVVEVDE